MANSPFLIAGDGSPQPRGRQHGLTLVEMLVAMTLTLVLMGAVAQIFGMLGQGINGSRSMAELNDRMRATAYRLRQDLQGATVDLSVAPPQQAAKNTGYLEIIEGPNSDSICVLPDGNVYDKSRGYWDDSKQRWMELPNPPDPYLAQVGSDDRLVGDVDDVIMLTTHTTGDLFNGRADTRNNNLEGGGLRSPYAEVAWFCLKNDLSSNPQTYTLYRHQRLVMAHPGAEPFVNTASGGAQQNVFGGSANTHPFSDWPTLYALTDVSCRRQGALAIPNSLADLARRENRFMHETTFPFAFPIPLYATPSQIAAQTYARNSPRFGEDVILTNVIAFDVRVWDPDAPLRFVPGVLQTGNTMGDKTLLAVVPGDRGYVADGLTAGNGAYVDLGWGRLTGTAANSGVSLQQYNKIVSSARQPATLQDPNVSAATATYDTWTTFYETNGIDENDNGVADDATNGLDDDGANGIDDAAERETFPPYAVPLKGIQIRLRCYEPSSRQIRQITINTL